MAEPRDRLIREDDPLTPMTLVRRSGSGIWQDFGSERSSYLSSSRLSVGFGRDLFGSPIQSARRSTQISSSPGVWGRRDVSYYGTPQIRNGSERREISMFSGSSSSRRRGGGSSRGRGGRGSRSNTPLPDWYPRAPLRDITAVVSAIERRRNRLRETELHRPADPSLPEPSVLESNQPIAGALLEPDLYLTTPNLKASMKSRQPAVQLKIFLDNNATDESDFLTPQKKLLNSIDEVEKVVMEELRRMKRTPSAKRAEREKKVRTLMAMR